MTGECPRPHLNEAALDRQIFAFLLALLMAAGHHPKDKSHHVTLLLSLIGDSLPPSAQIFKVLFFFFFNELKSFFKPNLRILTSRASEVVDFTSYL